MKTKLTITRAVVLFAGSILLFAGTASGAEINVMTSGGLTEAYRNLIPEFERTTKHNVKTAYGASTGGAPDSIPAGFSAASLPMW